MISFIIPNLLVESKPPSQAPTLNLDITHPPCNCMGQGTHAVQVPDQFPLQGLYTSESKPILLPTNSPGMRLGDQFHLLPGILSKYKKIGWFAG